MTSKVFLDFRLKQNIKKLKYFLVYWNVLAKYDMSTVMSNVIIDCVLFNEEWLTVINTQNRVMSIILLAKTYSTCICNKNEIYDSNRL